MEPTPSFDTLLHFISTGEPNGSFRSLRTVLFSLGLSRLGLSCTVRSAIQMFRYNTIQYNARKVRIFRERPSVLFLCIIISDCESHHAKRPSTNVFSVVKMRYVSS